MLQSYLNFAFTAVLLTWLKVNLAQSDHLKIDSLGNHTLQSFNTNGALLSIQQNGQRIYFNSFGYNSPEDKTKLTDSTVFPISSNTKAFNSILLSQLSEEGSLDFDTPIIQYLPNFKLSDEYITNQVTLTDLLTHRWGYPRYDFTFYMLNDQELSTANESVVHKMQFMEITAPFRTVFQYGNNQYILAAYLTEQITGQKWEDRLNQKILLPLEMNQTHCNLNAFQQSINRSIGYQNQSEVDIELAAPLYTVSGMGNMFSTINDLDKWCNFFLQGNDSVLSEDLVAYNIESQFNVGYEEPFKGFSNITYGFGWFIFDYFGHKVVMHHGDNVGHQSLVVLLPDDQMSWVIMANEGMQPYGFPFTMTFNLLEYYFQPSRTDWSKIFSEEWNAYLEHEAEKANDEKGKKVPMTLPLKDYVGEYYHPDWGTIYITLEKDKLIFTAGAYSDPLTHFNKNVFLAISKEFQVETSVKFILKSQGKVVALETDLIEPDVDVYTFKKVISENQK